MGPVMQEVEWGILSTSLYLKKVMPYDSFSTLDLLFA